MTHRETTLARYQSPSSSKLLARVLDQPNLVAAVRELPPLALGRLIDAIGLEGAGELVALATTEQLGGVFDRDLWTAPAPGDDEHFDASRFALWLEVMLEAGEAAVVERLLALPLELVTLAVHQLVLVVDIDALAHEMSGGGEDTDQVEKALESCLYEEWEEFRLMARDGAAWDAVLAALLALDRDHHQQLRDILECCASMSARTIEDSGGLYQVLSDEELLETDNLAARDDRRAAEGYVAPADARSFLALAREGHAYREGRDPVTRAYFRELAPAAVPRAQAAGAPSLEHTQPHADVARLMQLIARATGEPVAPASRLLAAVPSAAGAGAARTRPIDLALQRLAQEYPEVYSARVEELSYLSNVLVSGYAYAGRRLRPVEASEAAVAICNLGLAHACRALRRPAGDERATAVLLRVPADRLFRIAWRDVHDQPALWSSL